jgi:enoyl-CoA hydratase/carnithine racemase
MTTAGAITLERSGHVLLMGINRVPKRNAFDVPMFNALAMAYAELDRDDDLRAGVLFAHGPHFTAGLDLVQFTPMFASGRWAIPEGGLDPVGIEGPRVRKPIVGATQGLCLTIGIELLLATDIRIAAKSSMFAQMEVKRGIYPVGGATFRFPRQVGWGNAMRWLLTGEEFDVKEALRIGFVQEIVDDGNQVSHATSIAESIAEQAPLGVRATLASSRLAATDGDAEAARRLLPDLAPIMKSEDVKEGIQSFIERREAKFTGK